MAIHIVQPRINLIFAEQPFFANANGGHLLFLNPTVN